MSTSGVAKLPKDVGDTSVAAVMFSLLKAGYYISLPFGDNRPYDLVVETPTGDLLKTQIKTGRLRDNVIRFKTYSGRDLKVGYSYRNIVDALAIYCVELEKVYLVPTQLLGLSSGWLRYGPRLRNTQNKECLWANKFEVAAPPLVALPT